MDTFNTKDLTAADWNRLADQVLEIGVQRTAADILNLKQTAGDEDYNNPPGFSGESEEGEMSVRRSGRSKKDRVDTVTQSNTLYR